MSHVTLNIHLYGAFSKYGVNANYLVKVVSVSYVNVNKTYQNLHK